MTAARPVPQVHREFFFKITRRALVRINALRLARDLDFWPAAAFEVFATAAAAEAAGATIRLPDTFRARAARRIAPVAGGVFGPCVSLRQDRPDPAVMAFLERVAERHDLPVSRAALALAEWWASGVPVWEGAPHV